MQGQDLVGLKNATERGFSYIYQPGSIRFSNMKSTEEIKDFYDKYQFKFRPNVRHYIIINKLLKAGLKSTSHVLEIGCGNGSLTKLIAPKVKNGSITALDISSESIATAKHNLSGYRNIQFVISDVSDFSPSQKFDVVVLSDVLEHIREEYHEDLFKKIGECLSDDGFVFINIPEPKALEWIAEHRPENLQVIDLAIHSDVLMKIAYANGLYLTNLESYSIFSTPADSQSIIFTKRSKTFSYKAVPKWKIIYEKYRCFFLSRTN